MTIRHHKRQARLRAAASGNSLQSELNAIARENGHAAWGDFQSALRCDQTAPTPSLPGLSPHASTAVEAEALADAFGIARRDGLHLVVLRPTSALETQVISTIREISDPELAARFLGARFVHELTEENMVDAIRDGATLVAGSGDMPRDTDRGNFVVATHDRFLRQGQSIVSRRDQEIIYATTAVKYVLPQNGDETIEIIRGRVGSTTIRRPGGLRAMGRIDATMPPSTRFRSVDEGGMAIEMEWDAARAEPNADIVDHPFTPAFNVLGPKFLPDEAEARREHVERVAHILLPDGLAGPEYFNQKGRLTMKGFIHAEIGRAAREDRAPSIPAMIDWISGGLRQASDAMDQVRQAGGRVDSRDALSHWLRSIAQEAVDHGYDRTATDEITPLVDMAPNERLGILGAMDKGFLPFKNRHIRRRTS